MEILRPLQRSSDADGRALESRRPGGPRGRRGTRAAALDRRARAWSGRGASTAQAVVVAWRCPLPGDDTRAELAPAGGRAPSARCRASTGSTSTSATWTTTSCRPSPTSSRASPAEPARGRRRRGRSPRARAARQPVHRHPHPGARDRVGQGRGRASRRSPPTSRSRSPSAASGSPRSTPTCGASRCRACSASPSPPGLIDDVIVPPEAHGVRLISMGFFAREDQAVIWRGPMLHKALEQFLTDVYWGEPDYLVIDMPPGTGDVLALDRAVPPARRGDRRHHAAARGAAGRAACGGDGREGRPRRDRRDREHVVVHAATTASATSCSVRVVARSSPTQLGVPLLGQVPLVPALREGGDDGRPIVVARSRRRSVAGVPRRSPSNSTPSSRPSGSTAPSCGSTERGPSASVYPHDVRPTTSRRQRVRRPPRTRRRRARTAPRGAPGRGAGSRTSAGCRTPRTARRRSRRSVAATCGSPKRAHTWTP